MAFESTITEHDMDANSKVLVQGLRSDQPDREPDLEIDGLSDNILSRLLRLLGIARG